MKSFAELEAIRTKTLEKIQLSDVEKGARIVVGMATCGIAAGAKPVLDELSKQVEAQGAENVDVLQTGCIGLCILEPIVDVYLPGQEKVTYINVEPSMAERIIKEHIIGGKPVREFTVAAFNR